MEKIYINKRDSVPAVIHKILKCGDDEVVIYVPKESKLKEGGDDFHLIVREARSAGKRLALESVDENIIKLALSAGIEARNPFFKESRKPLADIIPKKILETKHLKVEEDEKEIKERRGFRFKIKKSRIVVEKPPRRRIFFKILILGTIVGLALLAFFYLPRAEINLTLKRTEWKFKDEALAAVNSEPSVSGKIIIPAQLFKLEKNLVLDFPASGEKYIQQKASGKITVYNAYSSLPQLLIKTTRFMTPDGKLFRLAENATVPGAKVVDGKIIPSSIEAKIEADKPGAEYNVGLVSRLVLPGFQGTLKYKGFYGEFKEAVKGGFAGKAKVPTETDIASAKDKAKKELEDSLELESLNKIPANLKVVDKASEFKILNQQIGTVSDEKGNFKVTMSVEKRILAFRESDLIGALMSKFTENAAGDFTMKDYDLKYGENRSDFKTNRLYLAIEFESKWVDAFKSQEFESRILGKKEAEIKSLILTFPAIEKAEIKLWPFWVKTAPGDAKRVKVVVD
jgi:hypothetical protein